MRRIRVGSRRLRNDWSAPGGRRGACRSDMELVGIADLAPTLSIRALAENDMIGANNVEYKLYLVDGADQARPSTRRAFRWPARFEELIQERGHHARQPRPAESAQRTRQLYEKHGREGDLPGRREELRRGRVFPRLCKLRKGPGQELSEADQLQHHRPDPHRGLRWTGRSALRRSPLPSSAAWPIPGDYHRGLTNALQMDKAPTPSGGGPDDHHAARRRDRHSGTYARDPRAYHHRAGDGEGRKEDHQGRCAGGIPGASAHPRGHHRRRASRATPSLFKYARDLGNRARRHVRDRRCGRNPSSNPATTSCTRSIFRRNPSPSRRRIDGIRAAMRHADRPARRARQATNRIPRHRPASKTGDAVQEGSVRFGIHTLDDFDVRGKTVLCRVDINQPVDRAADDSEEYTTRIAGLRAHRAGAF